MPGQELARVRGSCAPAGRCRGRGPAALLPYPRHHRDQARPEPGHHRRPRVRGRHPRPDPRRLPRARHLRRGARPGPDRCRAGLVHRSHRRHQVLHHRPPALRHAHRPRPRRPPRPRHHRPVDPARALGRPRRRGCGLERPPDPHPRLPGLERRHPLRHQPAHVRAASRSVRPSPRSRAPSACRSMAATATPTASWRPASPTSASRPISSPTTTWRWCQSSKVPAAGSPTGTATRWASARAGRPLLRVTPGCIRRRWAACEGRRHRSGWRRA